MADEDARKVELVRVPRQEQVFEREQVFGRDASSVFPTEGQKAAAEAADKLKSQLGANRFISETQIQELQKEYGGSTEGSEPIKPLAHILLEAKQAKDEAFQNQWKQMKQGKNRPLDEEEIQFVDALEASRRGKEEAERKQELDALEAYQLVAVAIGTRVVNVHGSEPVLAVGCRNIKVKCQEAVRAAADAQQAPSDAEVGALPSAKLSKAKPMGSNPMGPKKLPTAAKNSKAKPVIIRKRAQPPADGDAQQDVTQTASKQARLEREEVDVLSTSLPIPAAGTSRVDAQIRASIAQAGLDATTAGAQPDSASADQCDVQHPAGKGAVDPLGDSTRTKLSISPGEQNQGLLSSFLGNYGSDSDGSNEQAT